MVITSLGLIVFFIAQMISQFTGGATLIASITGMDHVTSLLIFGTVVILYTAIGGFSAVVITDTIQGIVMCIGTFLFIFFVLRFPSSQKPQHRERVSGWRQGHRQDFICI